MTTVLYENNKVSYTIGHDAIEFGFTKSNGIYKILDVNDKNITTLTKIDVENKTGIIESVDLKDKNKMKLEIVKSESKCTIILHGTCDKKTIEIMELYNKYKFPDFANYINGIYCLIVIDKIDDSYLLLGCLTDFMGIYNVWSSNKLEVMTTDMKYKSDIKVDKLKPSMFYVLEKSAYKNKLSRGKYTKAESLLEIVDKDYLKGYLSVLEECLIDLLKDSNMEKETICVYDFKENMSYDAILYKLLKTIHKPKKIKELKDNYKVFVSTGATWFFENNNIFTRGHEIVYNKQHIYPFLHKRLITYLWSVPEESRKSCFKIAD